MPVRTSDPACDFIRANLREFYLDKIGEQVSRRLWKLTAASRTDTHSFAAACGLRDPKGGEMASLAPDAAHEDFGVAAYSPVRRNHAKTAARKPCPCRQNIRDNDVQVEPVARVSPFLDREAAPHPMGYAVSG